MEARSQLIFVATLLLAHQAMARNSEYVSDYLESLYPAYKEIKDTVWSQCELIFKLKQTFFSGRNDRYWQVDGAELIPIDVCMTFYEFSNESTNSAATGKETLTSQNHSTSCWPFQWTNSLLMNIIPGDILLAMDSVYAGIIYASVVESSHYRWLQMHLQLNAAGNLSLEDYRQATALFFTSVCTNYISTHALSDSALPICFCITGKI